MFKGIRPFLVPVGFFLVWEALARGHGQLAALLAENGMPRSSFPDFSFLSAPSVVFATLIRFFLSGTILPFLWDTVWRTLVGFVIGAFFGVAVGVPIGMSRRLEAYMLPTVDALRSLPPIAILPLFILFFGIHDQMVISFVAFGAAWPATVNTVAAVRNIEPLWIKVARNLGHGARSVFFNVITPAALPGVATGLRISLSFALILGIVAEMLIGNAGLGHLLNYSKRNFDYPEMLACIIVIGLLGWLLNYLFALVDGFFLRWYYESKRTA